MSYYQFRKDDAVEFARFIGIKARTVGNELWFMRCPYCGNNTSDKNKFSINLDNGQFKCFRASCNAHGNMITLAKDFGFKLDTGTNEYYGIERKYFRKFPKREPEPPKPAAVTYMAGRGISEAVTERYQLTVRKDDESVIVFPFFDDKGELKFIKYRNTDPDRIARGGKEWCERDCMPILFGMNQCNPENRSLIITEGQIDSLSVTEAGIENAVSVPTGANGFTWIPHCWDWVKQFEEIIVFGDHEHGRITLLDEIAKRFGEEMKIKSVPPELYRDCKDANELLQKHGADAVRAAVEGAVALPDAHIRNIMDVKFTNHADREHFSTGIGRLDELFGGLYMGSLNIITGKRGEGKSTFASQMLVRALNAGKNVFAYSGELDDEDFAEWFLRQMAGRKHINRIDRQGELPIYSIEMDALSRIRAWKAENAYIYSASAVDDGKGEQQWLFDTIRKAIRQYDCKVILVDNLMTAMTDDTGSDLNQRQTAFVRKLKAIAVQMDVCVILVAHPRKGTTGDNDDISGSANITNLADTVISYGRPKDVPDSPNRTLLVLKNRMTGKIDTTGTMLFFEESSKRICGNNQFDFRLGWENREDEPGNTDGDFRPVNDTDEIPF